MTDLKHDNRHNKRVASSAVASVDVCSCGTMHLHIGALTLHLTEGAVDELQQTLARALKIAQHQRDVQDPLSLFKRKPTFDA